jgi:hypothetical protein
MYLDRALAIDIQLSINVGAFYALIPENINTQKSEATPRGGEK